MQKTSVKEICEFIWAQEEKHDLFSIQSRGLYFWPLIRFAVYHDLTQKTGVFGKPHPKNQASSFISWLGVKRIFSSLFLYNPFFTWGKKKTIIMPHGRRVNDEDIYCHDFIKTTPSKDLLVLYKDSRADRYDNSYTLDFSAGIFYVLFKAVNKLGLGKRFFSQRALTRELEEKIKAKFNVHVPVTNLAIRQLLYFKVHYVFYYWLFKLKKTQTLYLTTSYVQFAAIAAAQKCGVKVVELQHGTITKYHLGYSYPVNGDKVPYLPDEIHCFGKFWVDATPFAHHTKPVVTGFKYMQQLVSKLGNVEKAKDQVLVPSQGPVAKDLFPFAVEMAKQMPEKTFIYRLHPSEELETFESQLKQLGKPKNFRLSSSDIKGEPSTYELMAQSPYQIGVSSTTLLEGMCLGCKVGVLEMPSSEYMEAVIKKGHAFYAKSVDDVVENIDTFQPKIDPSYYYA